MESWGMQDYPSSVNQGQWSYRERHQTSPLGFCRRGCYLVGCMVLYGGVENVTRCVLEGKHLSDAAGG